MNDLFHQGVMEVEFEIIIICVKIGHFRNWFLVNKSILQFVQYSSLVCSKNLFKLTPSP
jgi:hypothetical protein